MSNSPADAVLAGTKTFAVALLAPLTTRLGVRPRIAADATQAQSLSGPGALVVIEYVGGDTLAGIERLVKDGARRVVAGVPAAHAGDEPALRALGVEIARWDGRPDAVLQAVDRRMGSPASAAAPAVAAGAPRPVAVATPAPAPKPAAAVAAPTRPAAPAAKPAAPAPVTGARLAAPAAAKPTPATAAAKPATAPGAAATNRAAAATGVAPSAGPAPGAAKPAAGRAAAAPAPAARPAAAPAPAARPAAAPAPAAAKPALAPAPATAKPAAAPAKPAAAPAPIVPEPPRAFTVEKAEPPPAPAAPARVAAAPAPSFFDDIGEDGVDVDPIDLDVSDAFDLLAPAAAVPAQHPPPAGDWPAALPDEAAATEALVLAIAGRAQGPYAAVAVQVVDGLSELEKAVLAGAPQPFDATAIRRAAATRLRVAQALATVPPAGSRVEQAAVNALLGEIDGLLSAVATLAAGLPPERQPAVEAVRHDLVAEAIDFSEAVQKVQPAEGAASPVAAPAPTAAARRAAQTRVISVGSGEAEVAEERRGRLMWIVLAVALLGAAGFHGYRYWHRQQLIAELPTVPGAPASMMLVSGRAGGVQLLAPVNGKLPDRAEVQRFKEMQQARGIEVRELSGGTLELRPAVKGVQR
jgi:hypothetical protein